MSAKANGMNMLIAGGVLYGITLATISIAQSIPAEILPLKYRTVASGISFIGGASGGLVAGLAAGAFCQTPTGWRNMFWVQAGLQLLVSALFFVFYWPPKSNREYPKMKIMDLIWACDPIGSVLFIGGATLVLTGLNWASGSYPWKDAHVVAPLTIGLVSLAAFGVYGEFLPSRRQNGPSDTLQNGKVDLMVCLPMRSSHQALTFRYPSSLAWLRAGCTTVP